MKTTTDGYWEWCNSCASDKTCERCEGCVRRDGEPSGYIVSKISFSDTPSMDSVVHDTRDGSEGEMINLKIERATAYYKRRRNE